MRFKLPIISLALSFVFHFHVSAQFNSSQIKSGLEKLNVLGGVLYIAAHPDDENTRLLAYLANERKVRTGYLSITRGDGGQNLIGTEQAEELGLIRTQELLAARRIDGAEQYFTRANDFGFSKTPDETFTIWNRERILGDVVWVIRKFRPDVIVTRFPGDARAGHGHHSASSILAQEAFRAAGDASRFPEQLKYVQPWRPKRIFWNTFNFGGNNTTSDDQLKINVGVYNSLFGKDYSEIAAESRSQHKSQGFGSSPNRGDAIEYLSLLAGEPAKGDLLDGVDLSWQKIPGGKEIQALIQKINKDYRIVEPSASVPHLLRLQALIKSLPDSFWKEQKLRETNELVLAAAGIWCEAVATENSYALGDKMNVRINAISRNLPAEVNVELAQSTPTSEKLSLLPNQLKSVTIGATAISLSQPYWLARKHPVGEYTINDQQLIGYPENPQGLKADFIFNIKGSNVSVRRDIQYKYTDQVRGEIYQSLKVAPPVTANIENPQFLFSDNSPQIVKLVLKAWKSNASGELKVILPKGWKADPASLPVSLKDKGDEQTVELKVSPSQEAQSGILQIQILSDGQTFGSSSKTISYDHIPSISYFPDAEAKLVKLDLKIEGKKIAYLMGAGDKVPEALKQVGYDVTLLNESAVMNSDLKQFDAIITGVRLYNVEPRMKFMNSRLLDYVEQGGVLLSQYNVNQPLVMNKIGPYPFTITRDRVTEENSKVKILNPAHPVFNYPNKITEEDFNGWIQERGIYFVSELDSKYEPLLAMNDTNEASKNGALIVTNYGKGRYVYTGLVFFRELSAGVPGAYRLFVNLLAKPKK